MKRQIVDGGRPRARAASSPSRGAFGHQRVLELGDGAQGKNIRPTAVEVSILWSGAPLVRHDLVHFPFLQLFRGRGEVSRERPGLVR